MNYKDIVKKKFPHAIITAISNPEVYTEIRWNTAACTPPSKAELDAAIAAELATENKAKDIEDRINTVATVAFSGSYTDLENKPTLFDGHYDSLSGKPTLFSGSYNDLTNVPSNLVSQTYVDDAISAVVANAPEQLNTLKEVADRLATDGDLLNALSTATNTNLEFTGDVTGSGLRNITLTLAANGVTPGTYNNSATAVQPFAVDSKGRVTGVSTPVTITPAWNSITNKPTIAVLQSLTSVISAISATTIKATSNVTPVSTDGTQIWTQTITPTASTSRINFIGSAIATSGTAARYITFALFRGTTCVGATMQYLATANKAFQINFNFVDSPATTSATTYTIRAFADAATTWYVAQGNTAIYNGMLAQNYITVNELA